MSASSPSAALSSLTDSVKRRQIRLPLRHSDFIIHHLNTDCHVHKLILEHHSAYFRVYFDTLTPISDMHLPAQEESKESATPSHKKHKAVDQPSVSSASPSSSSSTVCDHSTLIHCILFPDSFGIERVDDDAFHMFL